MSTQTITMTTRSLTTPVLVVSWICRVVAAVILLQTLFFKFTAAPESIYIFTKLGEFVHRFLPFLQVSAVEPLARIGSGVLELVAAILLLTPRFVWAGAILAFIATAGAVVSHLTFLGIEVQGDKGLLFGLAITVVVASVAVLTLHRTQIPIFGERFGR